jgi:predicted DNA-binding protein
MKKRVTFTLEEEIVDNLKKISAETMIPQAKLVEKAIENILKEYDKS